MSYPAILPPLVSSVPAAPRGTRRTFRRASRSVGLLDSAELRLFDAMRLLIRDIVRAGAGEWIEPYRACRWCAARARWCSEGTAEVGGAAGAATVATTANLAYLAHAAAALEPSQEDLPAMPVRSDRSVFPALAHPRVEPSQREDHRPEFPGMADSRMLDRRMADARRLDARVADARVAEARGLDARVADPRVADPRRADPRGVNPRMADPWIVDPWTVDPISVRIGRRADPYPAVEASAEATRRLLESLADLKEGLAVSILTRSPLVLRDLDLLLDLDQKHAVSVGIVIPSADPSVARRVESHLPAPPSPAERFEVVRALASHGIATHVVCTPIAAGVNNSVPGLRRLLALASRAGASDVTSAPRHPALPPTPFEAEHLLPIFQRLRLEQGFPRAFVGRG
jgi:hypothetical protein